MYGFMKMRGGLQIVLALVAVLAGAGAAPVQAEENEKLAQILEELAQGLESAQQDQAIQRAFATALDREPTETELRRYRTIMHEDHWSEQDVLDDLRSRGDYQRHSTPGAGVDPDRVIRRAYEDVLDREPDGNGLRHYRTLMVDQGWTEQDVRQDLRKSTEHTNQSQESAERIVSRAYRDILGREPDYNGLVHYRIQVMNHGWDQHDVERDLLMSPESRQKTAKERDNAVKIVNRAYQSVLHRQPDPAGLETYVDKVMRQHWSEDHVASELRHSDEYRNKHK